MSSSRWAAALTGLVLMLTTCYAQAPRHTPAPDPRAEAAAAAALLDRVIPRVRARAARPAPPRARRAFLPPPPPGRVYLYAPALGAPVATR